MKLCFCLMISLWSSFSLFAQVPAGPHPQAAQLRELNRDIWQPFIQAYQSGNAEAYLALHAPDFIRGEGGPRRISSLSEYAEGARKSFQYWKEKGIKADIGFRFLERIAGAELASERGIYRLSLLLPEGRTQEFYGKFHVFSRKINGVWKIVIDYDSNEAGAIDAQSFLAGQPLDYFNNY